MKCKRCFKYFDTQTAEVNAEYYGNNKIIKTAGDRVFCNTLGRSFGVGSHEQHGSFDGITSGQISQLVSMLPEGVTLKDELLSVGFDVSDIRYLICSDKASVSSHWSSSESADDGVHE